MRPTCLFATAAVSLLSLALASTARAQGEAPEAYPPTTQTTVPWQVGLGYRGAVIDSTGLSPFATNDYFGQATFDASRVLFWRGRFAFAAGAAWDYGATSAKARGADAGLTVDRVAVQLTMRYELGRWWNVFARIAPGATYASAQIQEASAPAPLVKSGWLASGDVSAGVAWSFADAHVRTAALVFWVTAEGGYGLTDRMSLAMLPDKSDPRQTGATDLGSLAMNGGFARIGVAVGF